MHLPDKSKRNWSKYSNLGGGEAKQSNSSALDGFFVLSNDCDIYWHDAPPHGQIGLIAKAVPTLSLVNLICDAVDNRIKESIKEGKAK